ncbi:MULTISPECIES: hypothetical protein [unclassified Nesterenkonia]|uniref:hypothetical protein n=1 Tax=unclassified Nesterenkonia TaxID=2629769 RepID=UPI0008721184|nr:MULTISPECIES: hypothetical protein [unclassified Nesterenkonia]MDS2173863.1 hypothetical protein [Nesterenkonia sp. CL21]OSM43392.1 hypothetical protein BCY76_008665 [Nesterenkonia sp. PF2B19]
MISNGKVKAYSGQGNLVGNLIAFLFVFGLLVGSVVAIGFWSLENAWIPGLSFMALWTLAFFVAKEVIGRSDSLEHQDLHGEHGDAVEPKAH